MLARKIGLFAAPLLFFFLLLLPVPGGLDPKAWKVIALAVFMLVWWVTEAVPIPVTALLPMVLLPMLDVTGMGEAAEPYANPIVFLFMGGFMIALAMEHWSLHRRIALSIVRLTGVNANGIILGFMLATAALSMWISNTATTVMMLPIALSVIDLLTHNRSEYPKQGIQFFALSMMLAIAYAANIGGTATLIGTPPNVVFAGYIRETYQVEVSFARWMMMGVPFAVTMIFLTYIFIVKVLFPNRLGKFQGAKAVIERELQELGPMSMGEKRTLVIFIATALAWIFRVNINQIFPGLDLSDAGIALLATVALFIVPVNFKEEQFVLEWRHTEKLPWGILLLFGGGLSLANALETTGIIGLIGAQFEGYQGASFLVILALTTVALFLTEIMSNVALVAVFLPVVGGVANGIGIPPLLICIPVTLAASCAFMLPMSTPPNAIVFASGHLRVSQMAKAGLVLNLVSILLIGFLAEVVLPVLFR